MENLAERVSLPAGVSAVRRREAIQHQKARQWRASKIPPGSVKTVAWVKNGSAADRDCPNGQPEGAAVSRSKAKR